eukprot:ANDGO_06529.mRNA.1 putative actin-related protein 2/3 complex subunit 2
MILIEPSNQSVIQALENYVADSDLRHDERIAAGDFDGTRFLIVISGETPNSSVSVHVSFRGYKEVMAVPAAKSWFDKTFGGQTGTPEPGYDVAVTVAESTLLQNSQEWIANLSNFKSSLFKQAVLGSMSGSTEGATVSIPYREDEMLYIISKPSNKTAIVAYQLSFSDQDDGVLAQVFLKEFADARARERTLASAPAVQFTAEKKPVELSSLKGAREGKMIYYVTFTVQERHFSNPTAAELLSSFRTYLHYHLKCSKAYLHFRMRDKVASWLQVLNRAKRAPFEPVAKKTMSGRTFVRK